MSSGILLFYVIQEVRVWVLKGILRVRVTMPNSVRGR